MKNSDFLDPLNSTKLICMEKYLVELIELHNLKKFPKVLMLSGKKGIGKFTLVNHFLNYIFSKNDKNPYNFKEKLINKNSFFYNQVMKQTSQDIFFIKAEQNKNIRIEDIRNLKSTISQTSLSVNPRFVIIDEVEFLNNNSVNALLKSLEEPSTNIFYILINNKQTELIKTISSRCFITNIFLNTNENVLIINYLLKENNINPILEYNFDLTPGLFITFNEIFFRLNIDKNDKILIKMSKLLNAYKKDKEKIMINVIIYVIDQYFFELINLNEKKLDFLLNIKTSIIKNINDFTYYNLNINSVLNSIEMKLNNV